MNKNTFFCFCWFFFFAALSGGAQMPASGAEIWQKAVALRAESFTLAPEELPYEQYYINKEGQRSGSETGCFALEWDETGKAEVSVLWARRSGRDFTAERAKRLAEQWKRFSEYLSFITPFDPNVQNKVERNEGTFVFIEGKRFREYEFRLPVDGGRSLVGKTRIDADGWPYDLRYTLSPLPFVMDMMEMRVTFDAAEDRLLFAGLDFQYEASFFFWKWKGGGRAGFDKWKRVPAPPRLN